MGLIVSPQWHRSDARKNTTTLSQNVTMGVMAQFLICRLDKFTGISQIFVFGKGVFDVKYTIRTIAMQIPYII